MANSKNTKVGERTGDSNYNPIPTIRDSIFVGFSAKDIELPSKIQIFDTKKIQVRKVEETSRASYVRVNEDIEIRVEPKVEYEIGEAIRNEEDALNLQIKELRKQRDLAKRAKKEAEQAEETINIILNRLEKDGLQYNEKGESIVITIKE